MKKIDLGQAMTILANLGVLVGILLLVYELNQNRQMMEAQTRNDLSEGATSYLGIFAEGENSELFAKADSGAELSRAELIQLQVLFAIQFRYYENVHYQYRQGLFDETEFEAQREIWRRLFNGRARAENWCDARETFSPEFVAEINGLMSVYPCE